MSRDLEASTSDCSRRVLPGMLVWLCVTRSDARVWAHQYAHVLMCPCMCVPCPGIRRLDQSLCHRRTHSVCFGPQRLAPWCASFLLRACLANVHVHDACVLLAGCRVQRHRRLHRWNAWLKHPIHVGARGACPYFFRWGFAPFRAALIADSICAVCVYVPA